MLEVKKIPRIKNDIKTQKNTILLRVPNNKNNGRSIIIEKDLDNFDELSYIQDLIDDLAFNKFGIIYNPTLTK